MTAVELALEKQRLQLEAASQRLELSRHAAGLMPLFAAGDQVREGVRWVGRHPEVVAGGIALLAAIRPGVRHFLWRWSKRSFTLWRFWRESSAWLSKPVPRPSEGLNSR